MSDYIEPMFWSGSNCAKPGTIAQAGYQAGDNPAAEHENYFRRQTYLCIKELQCYLFNVVDAVVFQKDDNGDMFYLDDDGNKLTGSTKINGVPYLFAADGELCTGWQMLFGKRYYYNTQNGNIVLGWITLGSDKYYVTMLDGKLVNQYRTIDGIDYHFDADGVAQQI